MPGKNGSIAGQAVQVRAWVGGWRAVVVLAVLSALAPVAARAQPVVPPASGPSLPGAAGTMVGDTGTTLAVGPEAFIIPADVAPFWDLYMRAGPVFTLGGGLIENRLDRGWAIQIGLRERWWTRSPQLTIFGEVGIGYASNSGDGSKVPINGAFRGLDPPDDHIHFERNGVVVSAPVDSGQTGGLWLTELRELERVSAILAIGGAYTPDLLNRNGNRLVQGNLRLGVRGGGIHAEYRNTLLPVIKESIREHFGHGHGRIAFSTGGGKDPDGFIGLFTTVGLSVTYPNARLGRFSLGTITLGADVEFGHDWFDMGDYLKSENGLSTFVPLGYVAISF